MISDKTSVLKPDKAPGPDKIHAFTLRELSDNLCVPLYIIFNKSLAENVVPNDWKMSNVTAIYKKGDRTDAGNYQPISLTSLVCRIMESILRDAILLHLQNYHLIKNSQHCFLPHCS